MKIKSIFEASDGRRFDDANSCEEHQRMIDAVRKATRPLGKIHKHIYDGWVQHDPEVVNRVKHDLLMLAKPLFKSFPKILQQIEKDTDKIHPMSIVGRILDDSGSEINPAWRRLCCIDSKGREFDQPYFALNGPDRRHKRLN